MPRDLFQPHQDDMPALARRAGIVPVSIVAHVIAISTAVLVPVLAGGALPDPRVALAFAAPVNVVPVVPPPPAPGPRRSAPAQRGAPIVAPEGLPPLDAEPPTTSGDGSDLVDTGEGFFEGIEGGLIEGGGAIIQELAPPPALRPVPVGGDIRPPVKVRDVAPIYPEIARAARVQGVVKIEATIDATGHVTETRLLQSVPLLDEAALTAVRQWVFTPTRLNGVPTPVIMSVTVDFRLR